MKKDRQEPRIENVYQLEGRVPVAKAIPFGLQHVLAMFVANIAPLIIIASVAVYNGQPFSVIETARLLQNCMLIAGIGTMLQLYPVWKIGSGLPVVMGLSFTFLAACMTAASQDYGVMVGAIIVGGVFEGILGLTAKYWRKIISPILSACVVVSIGLSILNVGVSSFGSSAKYPLGSWQNLLVAAITLFFRVDTVVITGEKRYTEAEIRQASGVEDGDNLFLLNKYQVIRNIAEALPYIEIENTRIQRKLPDTLLIQVQECGDPLAWTQDGTVWLMSPAGKIVEQTDTAAGYPTVGGCELLSPSVGTQIAVDTAYETRRESLLELLAVLDETGDLAKVDAIHLGEASYISMDYMDRFTVKIPYQADFSYKLRVLELAINSDKIQDNMTGTFDMRQEDGQVIFDQDTRK